MPPSSLGVQIVELLVDGVARGMLFALLGLGITLVFGLGGILNLAIGVFAVIAVLTTIAMLGYGLSLGVGIAVGFVVVIVLGLLVDRSVLSLVYLSEGEERELLGIFVTLGLATFIDGFLYMRFPAAYSLPAGNGTLNPLGLVIRVSSVEVIAVGAITFAVFYAFLRGTYLGGATRTVMQDEIGSVLCGIDTRNIRTMVFVMSVVVAAIAGLLYSLTYDVNVSTQFDLGIFAVIVSIVGGITSIKGTVAAGLFLGIIFTFASAFIGSYIANVVVFAVTVLVLLGNPEAVA